MTWGTQHGLFGEAKLLKDQQDSGFDVKATPPSCVHLLSQPASNAGVGALQTDHAEPASSHTSPHRTSETRSGNCSALTRKELTEATGQITDTSWGQRAHTARPYLKFHTRQTNLVTEPCVLGWGLRVPWGTDYTGAHVRSPPGVMEAFSDWDMALRPEPLCIRCVSITISIKRKGGKERRERRWVRRREERTRA